MREINLNVEIGPRNTPTVGELRKDLKKGESTIYFDKRFDWLKSLRGFGKGFKGTLVQALGQNLPLSNNSVSLVYAKDFFGAHNQITFKGGNKGMEFENIGAGHEKEWSRVLKRNGRVVICETTGTVEAEQIKRRFEKSGFVLKEEYHGPDISRIYQSNYAKAVQNTARSDNYALVFEK